MENVGLTKHSRSTGNKEMVTQNPTYCWGVLGCCF